MLYYILFDLSMAAIMLIIGILFYKSKGKAANFLTGYNMRPDEERAKRDEDAMCKNYGKRMAFMALPFLAGAAIDSFLTGIGCLTAWAIWLVLFILLLIERHRMED